jgi:single-stranded DNA-binding protein
MRLASSHSYKDEANSWKEKPCFIDVEAFDSLATRYGPHLKKGRRVSIEGRLKQVELERGKTYAIHAYSISLVERVSSTGAPAGAAAGTESESKARETPSAPEPSASTTSVSVSEALKRTAGVGEPPPEDAPFDEP